MIFEPKAFSVREAEFLSNTNAKFIYDELRLGVLQRRADERERMVAGADLIYLSCMRPFVAPFGGRAHIEFRRCLRESIEDALRTEQDRAVFFSLEVPIERHQTEIARKFDELEEVRLNWVESVPGVCSGEPVIKGTRIRVDQIASLHAMGVDLAEFEEEYGLSARQVSAALLYAEVYPKRGRPRHART